MARDLQKAIERFEERKKATLGTAYEEAASGLETGGEDVIRLMFNGLDLDFEEVMETTGHTVAAAMEAMAEGNNPIYVLKGLWIDGLLTALFLPEEEA